MLILLVGVAALWSAAWFATARTLERAAETWLADTAAAGVIAGYDELSVGGWPLRLDLRVERPRLLHPATGLGWQGERARGGVALWAPLRPELVPEGQQVVWLDAAAWVLQARRLRGGVRLALRPAPVDGIEIVLSGAELRAPGGEIVRLAEGALRAAPGKGAPWAAVDLAGLAIERLDWPEDVAAPPGEPVARFSGRVEVAPVKTGPWPPTRIVLQELALDWGATRLRGGGSLDVAPEGWPEGRVTFEAEAWEPLVALVVSLGMVPADVAQTWLQVLAALEEAGGVEDVLEVPLIFERGRISFGPVPLGTAPLLAPPRPGD